MILGKQEFGTSDSSVKRMALNCFKEIPDTDQHKIFCDIGCGNGELAHMLGTKAESVVMVDSFQPEKIPSNASFVLQDLNMDWAVESESIDHAFALEVIEHITNPRHFIKEMTRILKPGGYGFISTPNNLNLFSRLNFLFKGQHRYFQDSCYPAHISVLVRSDFERILLENRLQLVSFAYNHEDVIPLVGIPIKIRSGLFSNSIGVLFKKN